MLKCSNVKIRNSSSSHHLKSTKRIWINVKNIISIRKQAALRLKRQFFNDDKAQLLLNFTSLYDQRFQCVRNLLN